VTASIPPRFGLGLVALLACAAPRFAARTGDTLPRSVTLSAGWLFQPDPNAVGDDQAWQGREFDRSGWRPVTVPMAWDHYDPVMDGYEGVGWYALALPAERRHRVELGRLQAPARPKKAQAALRALWTGEPPGR
jgi:hypothetical protein